MSSIKNNVALNMTLALYVSNLCASELTSIPQNNGSTTASSLAQKAAELKHNIYTTFNNLRSSVIHYTKPYHSYGWPLTFAGLGSLNLYLYNRCPAADKFMQYLSGSAGSIGLGLSFYTAYKNYKDMQKYKQLKEQEKNEISFLINDIKEHYNELKNYVTYILFILLTQTNISDNKALHEMLKNELQKKKLSFNYAQDKLKLFYNKELTQLPKKQQLPVDIVVQNIILDTLGPTIALTTNAEGNYVIDPNNPANKTLNEQAISKKLTAIFSAPDEFSFDKKLIKSFFTEKENTSTSSDKPEQTFEHLYIQKVDQ